jgi:hypothetical protein
VTQLFTGIEDAESIQSGPRNCHSHPWCKGLSVSQNSRVNACRVFKCVRLRYNSGGVASEAPFRAAGNEMGHDQGRPTSQHPRMLQKWRKLFVQTDGRSIRAQAAQFVTSISTVHIHEACLFH